MHAGTASGVAVEAAGRPPPPVPAGLRLTPTLRSPPEKPSARTREAPRATTAAERRAQGLPGSWGCLLVGGAAAGGNSALGDQAGRKAERME